MGSEAVATGKVPALRLGPATRLALQLDALAAILPMDRRDRLAEFLTDDDVETLEHLEGMGREQPAGSRLFGDRPHRAAAVVAGDGGAHVEIRGA
jgi:hypothetical protein